MRKRDCEMEERGCQKERLCEWEEGESVRKIERDWRKGARRKGKWTRVEIVVLLCCTCLTISSVIKFGAATFILMAIS